VNSYPPIGQLITQLNRQGCAPAAGFQPDIGSALAVMNNYDKVLRVLCGLPVALRCILKPKAPPPPPPTPYPHSPKCPPCGFVPPNCLAGLLFLRLLRLSPTRTPVLCNTSSVCDTFVCWPDVGGGGSGLVWSPTSTGRGLLGRASASSPGHSASAGSHPPPVAGAWTGGLPSESGAGVLLEAAAAVVASRLRGGCGPRRRGGGRRRRTSTRLAAATSCC
jgi:hypothetical protein